MATAIGRRTCPSVTDNHIEKRKRLCRQIAGICAPTTRRRLILSGSVMTVSVPCSRCRSEIVFGSERCGACGEAVTRDLKVALEERLAATSVEFRTMRNRLREAAVLLFCLGALRIGFAI